MKPGAELPLGKRSRFYRFFEILPAMLSYGSIILLVVLSLVSPLLAAIYLMLIIITMFIRSIGVVYHTLKGHHRLVQAQKVNWAERLADLETPVQSYEEKQASRSKAYGMDVHVDNLRLAAADPAAFPKPSELYNMVIVAAYNEAYEVLDPTFQSLLETTYDNQKLIVALAYEERGGEGMEKSARKLLKKYGDKFHHMEIIKHPRDLPDEVVGKGGNISFAGRRLRDWCAEQGIAFKNVIVTTLDSDNRPHPAYFDYVTYEFIVNEDRKHLAYQPIALFINNIWDVPAPMRVVETGNTFWNIISSMRPHIMRNFASHSQPLEALNEMDFWTARSVVEDGHHFWRSYFHFSGRYSVHPIYIPIYQDAVLDKTYLKTLRAQFIQLRRWMYGASDIPFVAEHVFTKKRTVPLFSGVLWFFRALEGYVSAASVAILVAVGGWVPLLINSQAYRDVVAHELPDVISIVQRIALLGLLVMVYLSFKMLPPRPARYKRHRTIGMVLQWVLMPVVSLIYLSFAALNAQARLAFGKYLTKFDVTAKETVQSRAARKAAKNA
jgi:cellulose synthase/poly-beta-1,6-N-acetylglucosamine synthase-like glycosyltransferase